MTYVYGLQLNKSGIFPEYRYPLSGFSGQGKIFLMVIVFLNSQADIQRCEQGEHIRLNSGHK